MESSLYYTFSTIAQMLAAAIALLAAFALFRLQALSKILDDSSLAVADGYSGADHGTLLSLRLGSQYREFDAVIDSVQSTAPLLSEPFASRRRTFKDALRASVLVTRLMRWSLALTVCLVIASIAVLAATPRLAAFPGAVWILRAGVLWTALCLFVYARLVMAAVS